MRRLLPALTTIVVLVLTATSLATLTRRAGSHYAGTSSRGHHVSFHVTRDGKFITGLDFGTHTNPCGPGGRSLKRPGKIRIRRNGTFDDILNRNGVHDIEEEGITVTGRFLRGGRAKGRTRYMDRGCTNDPGVTWTAHVVRP